MVNETLEAARFIRSILQSGLSPSQLRTHVYSIILSPMGGASREGTERYRSRWQGPADHFQDIQDLWISSIGLGTYLGEMDEKTDQGYEASVSRALELGCNLIDTAINYRFQRSERNVGNALRRSLEKGIVKRDEVVVSSKGGFLSFDTTYPPNPGHYIQEEYIASGICKPEEIVAGCHCMTPSYLENQLERSLKNLEVDFIDIYFIHNPETQLSEVSRQEFLRRMLTAFKLLERKVEEGKIKVYGTATWNGYREIPGGQGFLSLEELVGLARNAGGEDHHFRAIQLPLNLAMPEALLSKNQKYGSQSVSLLEAAHLQKIIVLCSASILQGQLARNLPGFVGRFFHDLSTDAQRSIQFVRSTLGVTSALVGMSNPKHVEENLQVAQTPRVPWEKMRQLFSDR
ncbi:aldo/keto reductase [bacterium]|nr:aldo/keto reductase [bacterium]